MSDSQQATVIFFMVIGWACMVSAARSRQFRERWWQSATHVLMAVACFGMAGMVAFK